MSDKAENSIVLKKVPSTSGKSKTAKGRRFVHHHDDGWHAKHPRTRLRRKQVKA